MKLIILVMVALSGCAIVKTTDTYPNGRQITTVAYELGRTEAITQFRDHATVSGRDISVGAAQADVNVPAIQAGTEGLGAIIGAAIKTFVTK